MLTNTLTCLFRVKDVTVRTKTRNRWDLCHSCQRASDPYKLNALELSQILAIHPASLALTLNLSSNSSLSFRRCTTASFASISL